MAIRLEQLDLKSLFETMNIHTVTKRELHTQPKRQVSKNDKEMPESQIADQPTAP